MAFDNLSREADRACQTFARPSADAAPFSEGGNNLDLLFAGKNIRHGANP
jgi:hypothetical protein